MKKSTLFIFLACLLLIGQSFAAGWQLLAGAAIITSLCAIVVIYMFGEGFGIQEVKFLAKEEIYQLIITTVMVVGFIGFMQGADDISKSFSDGKSANLQILADQKINASFTSLVSTTENIRDQARKIALESSKNSYCNIMGAGMTMNGCGAYRVLLPSISLASMTLTMGLGELHALRMLLLMGTKYAFTLLLPFGIFLRTFKFTRGAGGLFIAMAVALYFILPFTIIFFQYMFDEFEKLPASAHFQKPPEFTGPNCDPFNALPLHDGEGAEMAADPSKIFDYDSSSGQGTGIEGNEANAMHILQDFAGNAMEYYIYHVLIKATLAVIISVLVTVLSIQRITAIAGTEMDMSVLSRLV
ncbi:MAG: hypothetical protein ABID61_02620 [Candidatus Micrarchaeota archaeon]